MQKKRKRKVGSLQKTIKRKWKGKFPLTLEASKEGVDPNSVSNKFISWWDGSKDWLLKKRICKKALVDSRYGNEPYLARNIPADNLKKLERAAKFMNVSF